MSEEQQEEGGIRNLGLKCCQLFAVGGTVVFSAGASQTQSPVGKGILIALAVICSIACLCCNAADKSAEQEELDRMVANAYRPSR